MTFRARSQMMGRLSLIYLLGGFDKNIDINDDRYMGLINKYQYLRRCEGRHCGISRKSARVASDPYDASKFP